jgi:hypothetical protein
MADWPTLTTTKTVIPMTTQPAIDPTIRSPKESGKVWTRLRFPAVPRRWEFTLVNIDDTDRAALETFEHTTVSYGSGTFNWTNTDPSDGATHVVRMGKPFVFTTYGVADLWQTPVVLVEASATQ